MDELSTTLTSALRSSLACLLLLPVFSVADETEYEWGGHIKARINADSFPDNSAFQFLTNDAAASVESDLRLNFSADNGPWSFDAAWQLYGAWGDRVELIRDVAASNLPGRGHLPNDDRRWLNLTDTLRDRDKFAAGHRLDRLALTYAKDKIVVRVGRQAISWGNSLVFSPMDIVNPFDPTQVDTEYKPGDDMIYAQYLRDNGHDIEFAHVVRRNPVTDDVESDVATSAVKYHGIIGESEFDLLLAENYGDTTIGIGGNRSVGGAVLSGDIVWSDTVFGSEIQLAANASYSWTWGGKNMSGVIEYYYNGFGQPSGRYDFNSLLQNPVLLARLERGQEFTLGRNYLAGGVQVELTPLFLLTPNLYTNLDDGSALLQVIGQYSLGDELLFLGAINVPVGPGGTEFGGVETGFSGIYLSTDASLFLQLAWYF